jgi:thiamine pyrophosphokinase
MVFMTRAIIIANGILSDPASAKMMLRSDDYIIAADGGLRNAYAAGITPHTLVGDFDSISSSELDEAENTGVQILRYPPEKDETDLELAIRHAFEKNASEIVVMGAQGGRLDQTLGNIALLADVPAGVNIRLDDGHEEVHLIRNSIVITGKPGDVVSLIPWGTEAMGVVTEGLRYPLKGETLHPQKTRGISNEMLKPQASVSLSQGTLIVIHTRV